jgi:hypothetical protein
MTFSYFIPWIGSYLVLKTISFTEEMRLWIKLSKALRIQGPTVSPKISRIRGPEIAIIRVVSQGDQENRFWYQFPDDL